ncbi:TPA: glycosyltransferase family 2 protein [Vibrio vulnificus]|nr:glycosyltransferase family 2 protein [Vibrio vulnificus]
MNNISSFKVSIITPTYNSEKQIRDTYKSIISQTFQNWEWIVTDDCSSDQTFYILEEIALTDHRVKLFRNKKNSGAAVSRNNSLSYSTGDFIAFLDSDDIWMKEKLFQQLNYMISESVDFSFTAYELIDRDGRKLAKTVDAKHAGCFTYDDMLKKKATLGCSTVMLRKNAFESISMPLLRTGQDYATWLAILKRGKKAYLLNQVLTQYRILPNSISRNKFKKAIRQWQIYRKVEKLPFIYAMACFISYARRAVFRK